MRHVAIHDSGAGAERLQIISYGNGLSYAAQFGEAGGPMRSLYFQGDDALALREELDALEDAQPDIETRAHWLTVLDPHL